MPQRTEGGRNGTSGNVDVTYRNEEGQPQTPITDSEGRTLTFMYGEDSDGNIVPVATDSAGRLQIKDVQFDGTVDIGDLQILDDQEQIIHPAEDGTVASLLSESTFLNSVNASDEVTVELSTDSTGIAQETTLSSIDTSLPTFVSDADDYAQINISADTVGLFKSSDFTETRTIDADNVGLAKETTLTSIDSALPTFVSDADNYAQVNISADTVGLFKSSDFTETREVTDVNTGGTQTNDLIVTLDGETVSTNLTSSIPAGSNNIGEVNVAENFAQESTLDSIANSLVSGGADELRTKLFGEEVGQGNLRPLRVDGEGSLKVAELENEPNLDYGQDSVGTTASALNGGTSVTVPDGQSVAVKNLSSSGEPLFVGDSNVGTGTGYELEPGATLSLAVKDVSSVYVVSASGSATASWIVEVE